jgi:hypothetical protein
MGIKNAFDSILIRDDFSWNFPSYPTENLGISISHPMETARDTGLFHSRDDVRGWSFPRSLGRQLDSQMKMLKAFLLSAASLNSEAFRSV